MLRGGDSEQDGAGWRASGSEADLRRDLLADKFQKLCCTLTDTAAAAVFAQDRVHVS